MRWLLKSHGLACGCRLRMTKERVMRDNRSWLQSARAHISAGGLAQSWLFRCFGLLLAVFSAWVPAAAQCYVFVPTHKSNSVAVIDSLADRVVAVVPVQVQPLSVAISPNGAYAYVTNSGWIFNSDSVSVIDTVTLQVVATIPRSEERRVGKEWRTRRWR